MAQYPCYKCGGSGEVPFKHIENGVCFTCGGAGQLSYQPREKVWTDPHPELLVDEASRSTIKQWDYLSKLTGEIDGAGRKFILAAGGKIASQRYISKAIMSRAIDLAKGAA